MIIRAVLIGLVIACIGQSLPTNMEKKELEINKIQKNEREIEKKFNLGSENPNIEKKDNTFDESQIQKRGTEGEEQEKEENERSEEGSNIESSERKKRLAEEVEQQGEEQKESNVESSERKKRLTEEEEQQGEEQKEESNVESSERKKRLTEGEEQQEEEHNGQSNVESSERKKRENEETEKFQKDVEHKKIPLISRLERRPVPVFKNQKREQESIALQALSVCDSVTDFKYFQKIDSEPNKYVQCDPWGTGKVKTCPDGLFWNEWTLRCDQQEHIRNMTLDLSKFSVTNSKRPSVNCSLVGMECLNGGHCVQSLSGDFKCACKHDFTGQFCESRVDFNDITHEILNLTFSVSDYKLRLQEENLTMNLSYYERFKNQLDNHTYAELLRYLSFYKDGEVRYDTLVNSLIEDILENIYPDAEYLSVFNASEQSVIAMVQMIPSLLSYSRYSFERYQDVFAQYQQVLVSLSKLLNESYPHIQEEASQYTILTRIFLNQTLSLIKKNQDQSLIHENPNVQQSIQLNETDIRRALAINYNETMKASEKLIEILEKFQATVVKELETNTAAVLNMTLGQAKFPGAQEVLIILNDVSVASAQIWESLVNYGFWYLTNLFSVSTDKVNTIERFSFNLNKF